MSRLRVEDGAGLTATLGVLADRAVTPFATTAERDQQWPDPPPGALAYVAAAGEWSGWDGTVWVPFQEATAPAPTGFAIVVDTADRTVTGTTYAAFPTIAAVTVSMLAGQVVEVCCAGDFVQSGASGATVGRAGFILDRPVGADLELKRARLNSAVQQTNYIAALYTATDTGSHAFKVAAQSGNASSVVLQGATAYPTHLWAKVLGTP